MLPIINHGIDWEMQVDAANTQEELDRIVTEINDTIPLGTDLSFLRKHIAKKFIKLGEKND